MHTSIYTKINTPWVRLFAVILFVFPFHLSGAHIPFAGLFIHNTEVIHNLPLEDIFYNECCDEGVYMTATAIIVINPNVLHVTVRDVTGVGLSTNEQYESIGAQFQTNVFYNSNEEGTFLFRVKMRNDNGCSFNLKGTFHVTVNANGDVTSQFINVETQCKD